MSNPGPTRQQYDSLICKLATLESELGQARKLLEAPKKAGWWKRFWGTAAVVVLVLAFLLLPSVSHAGEVKQRALLGLKGVYVLVECIEDPEAERLGLTEDQIKTDVELRLRKAGVRVLTKAESLNMPERPFIYVNVRTIIRGGTIISKGTCAYWVIVKIGELVTLVRGSKVIAVTWDTGMIGLVRPANIGQIRKDVGDQVDKFINDYMAANPK